MKLKVSEDELYPIYDLGDGFGSIGGKMSELLYWSVIVFTVICFAVEYSIKGDDE